MAVDIIEERRRVVECLIGTYLRRFVGFGGLKIIVIALFDIVGFGVLIRLLIKC